MRLIPLTLAVFLLLAACNNKPASGNETTKKDTSGTSKTTDTVSIPMTGNDRDEHGCIGSAGYTWSAIKNDCIRIFEAGKRLNAAEAVADKTTSAFAVFSDDSKKAELFIPRQSSTGIIFEQGDKTTWTSNNWTLGKTAKGLVLKKDGVVQYAE